MTAGLFDVRVRCVRMLASPCVVEKDEPPGGVGEIPSRHGTGGLGARGRVELQDDLAYSERRQDERRRLLDELTANSVEAGTYDRPASDF